MFTQLEMPWVQGVHRFLRWTNLIVAMCLALGLPGALVAQTKLERRFDHPSGEIRRLVPLATDRQSSDQNQAPRTLSPTSPSLNDAMVRVAHLSSVETATEWIKLAAGEEPRPSQPLPGIKPMQEIDLRVTGDDQTTPTDYASQWTGEQTAVQHVFGTSRDWATMDFQWTAPAVAHQPLYFEDVNLERYGYSCGVLQPAVSSAHFFGNVMLLPYHLVETPPCQCVYSLGYHRPGSCAPYYPPRLLPMDACAAAAQAVTIAGLILLIP